MKKTVLKAVKDFSLLGDYCKATVTVALSGGADSMALLHVLLSLKDELGITVEAAHFNHLIRGDEAKRDEDFVKQQCKKLGVKLYIGQGDVPAFSKEKGISLELAAREMRYDYLNRINKDFVATAHTASDNLETVIFNLCRGSSIEGLCGIPPKRGVFIRPLILCTREQIEDYCRENDIPYVTDSTNLSDDYTRNKIRHRVVSVLKEINPSVEKTVGRMSAKLKADSEYLEKQTDLFLKNNVDEDGSLQLNNLGLLDNAIKSRVIKSYVESVTNSKNLEAVHIDAVMGVTETGGKVSLPEKYTADCECGLLTVTKGNTAQKKSEYIVNMTESAENFFEENQKINNLLLKNSIDCDKIVGKCVVRTRQSGDSIRLKNRGCTKTLTKLYNECNIPVAERDSIPVVADDKGVVWIYGVGVAHRCAVGEKTKRVLIINAERK